VLKLASPHRFDQHVDEVLLVDQTLLIGPGGDSHIRHRQLSKRVILLGRRANQAKTWQWWAKQGSAGDLQELTLGQPMVLESLTMTLEAA